MPSGPDPNENQSLGKRRIDDDEFSQGCSFSVKRSRPQAPNLTISISEDATSSQTTSSDSLLDTDGASKDTISDVDSLFDDLPDDGPTSSAANSDLSTKLPTFRLIPAACRTVPPIPGLFFDPSLLLPTALADQLLHQCLDTYFQNPLTNQIMLFGRARDPSSSSSTSSPSPKLSHSGLPQFLNSLLSHLEEILLPSVPLEVHRQLFPPSSEPSRARQAIINLYRPGEGIAPHVDLLGRFGDGIIGVSLGSGCIMNFRKARAEKEGGYVTSKYADVEDDVYRDENGERKRWDLYLPMRSVLVLSGDARYRWTHGIEKKVEDFVEVEHGRGKVYSEELRQVAEHIQRGERLSITFRWLLPGADVVGRSEVA